MNISNASEARAWLYAWGGRPRLGILREALRGVRMARGIVAGSRRYSAETVAGYDEAIAVLEAAI